MKDRLISLRVEATLVKEIDDWAARQAPQGMTISRSDALRMMIVQTLSRDKEPPADADKAGSSGGLPRSGTT